MDQSKPTQWSTVDASGKSSYFVQTLDIISDQDFIKNLKNRSYELMAVAPGSQVLDMGCGTGEDVKALAEITGKDGRVIGIDNSMSMIQEAQKRHGSNKGFEFKLADINALPFESDSMDAVRAERVFQHVFTPMKAMSEAYRVLKPGAHMLTIDPDWGTIAFSHQDKIFARKIQNAMCDRIYDGWVARKTTQYFRQAGLKDISVTPIPSLFTSLEVADRVLEMRTGLEEQIERGNLAKAEVDRWYNDMGEMNEKGDFFVFMAGFMVVGTK